MKRFGIDVLIGVIGVVFLALTVVIAPLFIVWAVALVALVGLFDNRSN